MLVFNKILLMLHFLGLAMGLATGFANMIMMGLIKQAAPAEKPVLGRFPFAMAKVGKIGLGILIVTGLAMVFTRWRGFGSLPWTFHAKLTAVVLLIITVGWMETLMARMKRGDASAMPLIETGGKLAFAFAIIAVVFA